MAGIFPPAQDTLFFKGFPQLFYRFGQFFKFIVAANVNRRYILALAEHVNRPAQPENRPGNSMGIQKG